jgi:KDO2-lipid IV(A) lauroyltransferase
MKLKMKRKKLRIIQLFEYFGVMGIALPFYLLPITVALLVGEWVGEMMYRLMSRRRAIGYKNLNIAFGDELSDQEKERVLRSTFRNFGKSFVEVIHFPKMSKSYIRNKVSIIGQENYLEAMIKGRGVIILTAHFGNWEMSSYVQSVVGYPLNIVVRPLDNSFLDGAVTKLRTMHGNKLFSKKKGLRQITAALKNQETVGILMDQNTLPSQGVFVDFFGEPACTIPVIAILALRYDVPVIPSFIVRTDFDTHTLYIDPEIEVMRTCDAQKDIRLNTANYNKIIEKFIRKYPDQWFWIHNRWKSQAFPKNFYEHSTSLQIE